MCWFHVAPVLGAEGESGLEEIMARKKAYTKEKPHSVLWDDLVRAHHVGGLPLEEIEGVVQLFVRAIQEAGRGRLRKPKALADAAWNAG